MTRREAIEICRSIMPHRGTPVFEALDMAINALEQKAVLDKIRAEIMSKDGLEEALEIIDKYKAESEDKE